MIPSVRRDSVEYVRATVTADAPLDVAVSIRLDPDTVWHDAVWEDEVGEVRTARTAVPLTFSPANFPRRSYQVLVRLEDTPEVPILSAYALAILGVSVVTTDDGNVLILIPDPDHVGYYIPVGLIPDPDHPGHYLTTGLVSDPDHAGYYLIGA